MASNKLVLYVRFNSQHAVPIAVEPEQLIEKLREEIAEKYDMPAEDIRIIFQGKILDCKSTVQDYGLGEQTIVHVVRRRQALINSRNSSRRASPAPNEGPTPGTTNATGMSVGLNYISEIEHPDEISSQNENNETRLQFYVYCKACCDIQPGKLRLCCRECKQGTFVLNEEPTRWSDIRASRGLRGRCHAELCNGCQAEFYFKCAAFHNEGGTEEKSVGLELVKSNAYHISCITCLEIGNPVVVFSCTEGHVMCLECFHLYATSKLNDRAFIHNNTCGYTLPCPAGCEDSLIEDAHHFRILGADQYERYQKFGAEQYVIEAGGLLCPRPDCGAGILPYVGQRRVVCLQGCGLVFCATCLNAYHDGECPAFFNSPGNQGFLVSRQNAEQSRWERQSHETIKNTTHPCPKCKIPVERNGGCMHMTCPRCGFNWCWICQTEWNRDCQADHWFE